MLRDQELVEVNYFSARPVDDPQPYYNQDKFFQANEINPKFKIHLGLYKKKKIKCQNCGFKIKTYEEKESDVLTTCQTLCDEQALVLVSAQLQSPHQGQRKSCRLWMVSGCG